MAGKKTPRRQRKYDHRYHEGKLESTILSLELMKADILRDAQEYAQEIDRIIKALK